MLSDTLIQAVLKRLAAVADERAAIARELEDPAVLADHRKVRDLSIHKAALDPLADALAAHRAAEREIAELEKAQSGGDPELAQLAREELPVLRAAQTKRLEDAAARLVTADDQSVASVLLEVRAGVGGDEAGLWAAR